MKQLLAFLKATLLGGVLLMSFKDFPPRQKPGSFTIDKTSITQSQLQDQV